MATSELQSAFNEIGQLRALPQEVIMEALQNALISAYRRYSGASAAQEIEARIDKKTNQATILVEKEVVDDIFTESTEVLLADAQELYPDAQMGDLVMMPADTSAAQFGRIAAQTAKQVILQRIREAERDSLYEEFIEREGDLITGTVQSVQGGRVTLGLGRTEAFLHRPHQIPRERYHQHEKLRVLVLEVKKTNRGPEIVVSRSHRNMLRRLLEYEVPEIYNGQVEVKSIAREAGYRSKVAVAALQEGIDPVGACVGMRGIRIQNIVRELGDERIDVIEWNPDNELFISKALSPARVIGVYLQDDLYAGRTAVVVVPNDQLSLAIGKEGQNARLAAKLTGWRIDIKSVSETVRSALENLNEPPLSDLTEPYAELIEQVNLIIEKQDNNMTVMPEEYNILNEFADIVETRYLEEREEIRRQQEEEINSVRATLPQLLFEIPIEKMGLRADIAESLESVGNAGEIMLMLLLNEDQIRRMLVDVTGGNPLQEIQDRLDELVLLDEDEVRALLSPEEVVADEVEETEAVAEEAIAVAEDVAEEITDEAVVEEVPAVQEVVEPVLEIAPEPELEFFEDEKKSKKGKKKSRQLVFDEKTGQTVAKRRRKGSRKRDSWEEDEFDY